MTDRRIPLVLTLLFALTGGSNAQDVIEKTNPSEVLKHLGLGGTQEDLLAGEIVSTGAEKFEKADDQLAAAVVMVVKRPLKEVADSFRQGDTIRLDRDVMAYGVMARGVGEKIEKQLGVEDLKLKVEEVEEARKLLAAAPGTVFNLSRPEMEKFQELKKRNMADVRLAATVSRVYREILEARYERYRQKGIQGIVPYHRDSGVSSPGEDLRLASAGSAWFRKTFPKYRLAILEFPEQSMPAMEHAFLWMKVRVEDRPAFVLSHWCGVETESYVLITERQYYVGHGYDSLQVQMGLLPHGKSTIIFYMNRIFTEGVTGFGGAIKKSFGRGHVVEAVQKNFMDLRKKIEAS